MTEQEQTEARHRRIAEESRRFRARLPELLPKYNGRWVVFRDGAVHADCDTEDEAYAEGIRKFGSHGGFVLHQVTPDAADPILLRDWDIAAPEPVTPVLSPLMSARVYLAGQALAGLLSRDHSISFSVDESVKIADAILRRMKEGA